MTRRRPQGTRRDYPRTARVNELVREIVADELTEIDDRRLELVTITGVEVTRDLEHGTVYFDSLEGADGDAETVVALESHRVRFQSAIGRQARMRRTPELRFLPDPAVRGGERIDELLRELPTDDDPLDT